MDNLIWVDSKTTTKEIHEWFMEEWKELKIWAESNNKKILLNDYLNNPEKEFFDVCKED